MYSTVSLYFLLELDELELDDFLLELDECDLFFDFLLFFDEVDRFFVDFT
jgi:hypothetical protein